MQGFAVDDVRVVFRSGSGNGSGGAHRIVESYSYMGMHTEHTISFVPGIQA